MNAVNLYGRIANDLELQYTKSNKAVLRLSIAVRGYSKDQTDFIRCQVWDKRAETLANYFHKGSRIVINGRLASGKYEKDGQTHYTQDVVVDGFDFVDSKQESHQGNSIEVTDQELPF
ncbi:single-stranded DNA-binding protein [Lactobacillus sp. CBA3605]|uniref:single-stranded DNA-binding protein n=1 Tax=Lactobacillus sp. CBA3605 TaxID=2099788 RepID=UPI000CFB0E20|nr:single-stranded DNA-binding protein [Lactobacillus sp. CBA3605]AVK60553.1 single-stranded DNA-binding protein [Lactobacillus sp. CBA3605]